MNPATAIPLILSSIATLARLYRDTVNAGRQSQEFTPEQEAAWQAQWDAIRKGPEWELSTAAIPLSPISIDQRNTLSDSTI